MPDIMLSKEGIEKLLTSVKKINPGKASGPNIIPARILLDMALEIFPIFTFLIQKTPDLGELEIRQCFADLQKRRLIQGIKTLT